VILTNSTRKNEVGFLLTGSPFFGIRIPPGQSNVMVANSCPSDCTTSKFPSTGIVVFAASFHMHTIGARSWIQVIRGGIELMELHRDDHFDFQKQVFTPLTPDRVILPGDTLITHCGYDSSLRTNVTNGGISTNSNEM
jgi:hypothetical protein